METAKAAKGEGRGAGASVRRGYILFANSFGTLLRSAWVPVIVFCLMCGLLGRVVVETLPRLYVSLPLDGDGGVAWASLLSIYGWPLGLSAVAVVVGGVAELCTYGNCFALLASYKAKGAMELPHRLVSLDRHYLWRTLKGVLGCLLWVAVWMAVVGGLAYALVAMGMAAKAPVATAVGLGVLALALAMSLLPLAYVVVGYILSASRLWLTMGRGFKVGYRHYGYLFVVCLFCAVVSLLVSYILAQPAVILGVANAQAQLGAAMGDPLGMPSYIGWLSFAVFTLAGLVMLMVRLSMLFPLYYMQVSIDTAEEERKQYREELKD